MFFTNGHQWLFSSTKFYWFFLASHMRRLQENFRKIANTKIFPPVFHFMFFFSFIFWKYVYMNFQKFSPSEHFSSFLSSSSSFSAAVCKWRKIGSLCVGKFPLIAVLVLKGPRNENAISICLLQWKGVKNIRKNTEWGKIYFYIHLLIEKNWSEL